MDLGLDFRFETASSFFFLLNYGLHLKNPGLMSPAYTVRKRSQEEGEAGTNWEIKIDINPLPCVKQVASGHLL